MFKLACARIWNHMEVNRVIKPAEYSIKKTKTRNLTEHNKFKKQYY